jgi:hypothetical protein
MSNNNLPPVPLVPGSDDAREGEMEVDDEIVLDPDADPDQVDSAEADRLAAGAHERDGLLGGGSVKLP